MYTPRFGGLAQGPYSIGSQIPMTTAAAPAASRPEVLSVTVSKTETLKDSKSKDVVFYVITCLKGQSNWVVRKRFTEFDNMQNEIKVSPQIAAGMRHTFPKKTFFFETPDPNARMIELDKFMQEVVSKMNASQDAVLSRVINDFVQTAKNHRSTQSLQTNKPMQPSMAASPAPAFQQAVQTQPDPNNGPPATSQHAPLQTSVQQPQDNQASQPYLAADSGLQGGGLYQSSVKRIPKLPEFHVDGHVSDKPEDTEGLLNRVRVASSKFLTVATLGGGGTLQSATASIPSMLVLTTCTAEFETLQHVCRSHLSNFLQVREHLHLFGSSLSPSPFPTRLTHAFVS
jgi:hypothetical protein